MTISSSTFLRFIRLSVDAFPEQLAHRRYFHSYFLAICNHPGTPRNGAKHGRNFESGSTVNFTCNAGYTLVGSKTIECRSGRWSSNSPHCKSKLCFHYHHRRTGRGGARGATAPPQILGNKRKFGQSQVLKTFRCFFIVILKR